MFGIDQRVLSARPNHELSELVGGEEHTTEPRGHQPVRGGERSGVEHRLQRRQVADARHDDQPEALGQHQRNVREQAHPKHRFLVGADGEAVEELSHHHARLGHGQRLSVVGLEKPNRL